MSGTRLERIESLAAQAGGRAAPPECTGPGVVPGAGRLADLTAAAGHPGNWLRASSPGDEAGNPVQALEQSYAELEGAEAAMAAVSGAAAVMALFLGLLEPGDHVVAGETVAPWVRALLDGPLQRWGLAVSYADTRNPAAVAAAAGPRTRILLVDAIADPTTWLADLPALSRTAFRRGAWLVVENSLATPFLVRPLQYGADLVITSAPYFLCGCRYPVGGLVAGSQPLISRLQGGLATAGGPMHPATAWLWLQGLKSLHLRMERQSQNALALGWFLERHPAVERVHYPGLPSHPQAALARRLLPHGTGAILSFAVHGGAAAAEQLLAHLQLPIRTPVPGDVTTAVCRPAAEAAASQTASSRTRLGIGDNLIRVSVGAEAADEVLADFARCLGTLAGVEEPAPFTRPHPTPSRPGA